MTTMTTESADTTGPDNSWTTGYTDGFQHAAAVNYARQEGTR